MYKCKNKQSIHFYVTEFRLATVHLLSPRMTEVVGIGVVVGAVVGGVVFVVGGGARVVCGQSPGNSQKGKLGQDGIGRITVPLSSLLDSLL